MIYKIALGIPIFLISCICLALFYFSYDFGKGKKSIDKESPSPLLFNMEQLGISFGDFATMVISHNHMDHVGGMKYQAMKSFSIDKDQVPLGNKRIYTPVPMTYPGQNPVYAEKPRKIAEGITTTGVIPSHLYLLGAVGEQAMAVNLERKGIAHGTP